MDNPVVRKQIGLLFFATYQKWAGGLMYIINLIRALNLLSDHEKPELIIFHSHDSPVEDIEKIKYPYIRYECISSASIPMKIYFRLKRILSGKSAFYNQLPEVVYPYDKFIFLGKTPINWIPDFQEWYLPELFSEEEITKRKTRQQEIAASGGIVVFSSEDSMNDFKKFFPENKCQLRLLKFASLLPDFSTVDNEALKQEYGIKGTYFMSPNQFWAHKNHLLVLKAVALLKDMDADFQIVFTGSQSDYRNKTYFQTLQDFVTENKIERWVKFLGFIDRKHQLSLMKNARAVVQPSLFEGWSTVVEDTKAMNQYIILSDLPVHKEQLQVNCTFFDRRSETDLANALRAAILEAPKVEPYDYDQDIKRFSGSILDVLSI